MVVFFFATAFFGAALRLPLALTFFRRAAFFRAVVFFLAVFLVAVFLVAVRAAFLAAAPVFLAGRRVAFDALAAFAADPARFRPAVFRAAAVFFLRPVDVAALREAVRRLLVRAFRAAMSFPLRPG